MDSNSAFIALIQWAESTSAIASLYIAGSNSDSIETAWKASPKICIYQASWLSSHYDEVPVQKWVKMWHFSVSHCSQLQASLRDSLLFLLYLSYWLTILPLRWGTGAEMGEDVAFSCLTLFSTADGSEGYLSVALRYILPLGLWFMI